MAPFLRRPTNAPPPLPLQPTSFLGRMGSSAVTVQRTASNAAAGCGSFSRSFVFGSDHSNHSHPGLAAAGAGGAEQSKDTGGQQQPGGKGRGGRSSSL